MSKIKKILLILPILALLFTIKAYANEFTANFSGDGTIESGKTKTITFGISSQDREVICVSGVISVNNINLSDIRVRSIGENWNLTYNEEKGNFIIQNAYGTKNATIIAITYTVSASNTNETISINANNLNITTSDYAETKIGNITKTITVQENAGGDNEGGDNEGGNNEGGNNEGGNNEGGNNEGGNNEGGNNKGGNNEGGNNEGGKQQGEEKKTTDGEKADKKQSSDDPTVAPYDIPQGGANPVILIVGLVMITAGIITFIKYRKMKDI